MADKLVYLGVYTHRHGTDVAVYDTKEAAWEGCTQVAEDFWDESVNRWREKKLKRPKNRADLCRRYFEEVEDESFEVWEREIVPTVAEPAGVRTHEVYVTVTYTMEIKAGSVVEAQEIARKEAEFMAGLSNFPYTIEEVD